MRIVTVRDADVQLSELLDRVEAGETIRIERGGRVIAEQVGAVARQPFDLEVMRKATEGMAQSDISAGDFVRAMRDAERY